MTFPSHKLADNQDISAQSDMIFQTILSVTTVYPSFRVNHRRETDTLIHIPYIVIHSDSCPDLRYSYRVWETLTDECYYGCHATKSIGQSVVIT